MSEDQERPGPDARGIDDCGNIGLTANDNEGVDRGETGLYLWFTTLEAVYNGTVCRSLGFV